MTEAERIIKLETQMNNIEEKVDEGFAASKARHDDLKKLLTDFIEKSDSRFANKWVEKVFIFVGSAVGLSIIGAILALIIKKPL